MAQNLKVYLWQYDDVCSGHTTLVIARSLEQAQRILFDDWKQYMPPEAQFSPELVERRLATYDFSVHDVDGFYLDEGWTE